MAGNVVETLIGAVVITVAAVFLGFAYTTAHVGGNMAGYQLNARFSSVDGLNVGADVRLSGIKVGTITGQRLDPQSFSAIVTMTIANDIKLPDDTAAKVAAAGLLGANYLALEPGGSEKDLAPGAEIKHTQGSVNLIDLIGQAVFGAAGTAKTAP